MNSAEPALSASDVAAWLALLLAIMSIAAQFLARHLDGGRIQVHMQHVLLDDFGTIYTLHTGRWPMKRSEIVGNPNLDPSDHIELAEVVVANKGRNPVTVHDIGLVWRTAPTRKHPFGQRHHIVPRTVRIEDRGQHQYLDVKDFRLEPADRMSMLFDYWAALDPDRKSARGALRIRASAQVAGRRRSTKSPRRLRWVIKDTAVSGVSGTSRLTARGVIHKSLRRTQGETSSAYSHSYLARLFESKLGGQWPNDYAEQRRKIEAVLDQVKALGEMLPEDLLGRINLEIGVHNDLARYSTLIDWADISIPDNSDGVFATNEDQSTSSPEASAGDETVR